MALALAIFLVSFVGLTAWLVDGALLWPQAGLQSILAADSVARAGALEIVPGTPFSKYPPLYPLLLAACRVAGLSVTAGVVVVNALTLSATLAVLHLLARELGLRQAWIAPALYLGLGAAHYLLRAARADAIPILASLVTVLALARYARHGRTSALLLAALACAAAGLARYMAMFTLIPLGLAGAFLLAPAAGRCRDRDGRVFALVACTPPALWLLRNQLVKGAWKRTS